MSNIPEKSPFIPLAGALATSSAYALWLSSRSGKSWRHLGANYGALSSD